jgi:L-aspartate oxidase
MVSFEQVEAGPTLIIGSGLAALSVALKLAPLPVTILSDQPVGVGGSTPWAQGGIAAALGEGDTPETHAQDTIRAGGGLVNEEAAKKLALGAQACIQDLIEMGVPFDQDEQGRLILGL